MVIGGNHLLYLLDTDNPRLFFAGDVSYRVLREFLDTEYPARKKLLPA
jgi:hypothetical protein